METIEGTPTEPQRDVIGDVEVIRSEGAMAPQPQPEARPRAGAQLAFARFATALAMIATGALAIGALNVGRLVVREGPGRRRGKLLAA
jgi:hypothetical protein